MKAYRAWLFSLFFALN